ncbi:MAG: site-specific integrase [Bacteroidales bacterium]|nr:site-specific integrase [Bacteroidales bacterium]
MATVAAVVHAHQRRADGTYNVKIRITHHRQSVHLPSSLTVTADDLTRGLAIKSPEAKRKAADMVGEFYRAISKIPPFALEQMTVRDVVEWCRRELRAAAPFHLDFYAFADEYIAKLRVAPSTRDGYRKAARALRNFAPDLDATDITVPLLEEFVQASTARGLSPNTVAGYMSSLGAVYKAAQRTYNDEDTGHIPLPRRPFDRVKVARVPSQGARALTREEFQMLLDTQPSDRDRLAIDLFIISFGLMGMNFADIRKVRRSQIKDGVLTYHRSKTENHRADRALMKVTIHPQLEPYIARHAGKGAAWLDLPDLASCTFGNYFSQTLRRWADVHGLEPFKFNSARHTWATLAIKAGVEKARVDEALAHVGDLRTADAYIERDWDIINAANTKVLSLFVWPSNSQE